MNLGKYKIAFTFQMKIIDDIQSSNREYSKKNASLIAELRNSEEQAVATKKEKDELHKNLLLVKEENAKLEIDLQEKENLKITLGQVIKEREQTETDLQDKVNCRCL